MTRMFVIYLSIWSDICSPEIFINNKTSDLLTRISFKDFLHLSLLKQS